MSIFEGTQPRFRQVPPMGPFSTMAVLRPFAAAAEAIIIPEPEPMTRTSNLSIINHDRKRTKHQINFSNGAIAVGKSYFHLLRIETCEKYVEDQESRSRKEEESLLREEREKSNRGQKEVAKVAEILECISRRLSDRTVQAHSSSAELRSLIPSHAD